MTYCRLLPLEPPEILMPNPSKRFIVNASLLIKLRWVAVFGQVLTILAVIWIMKIEIASTQALAAVIGVTALSNLLLSFWYIHNETYDHPPETALGLIMVMDMLSLTCLLFATGGPSNPFSFFFFVNLSLCALILNRNWAWALNVLSIFCYGALLLQHHPIAELDFGFALEPILDRGRISIPQAGLMIAFSTCASVIVYFMTRLTSELRQQEEDLRRAQVVQARSEKLEALGTLAAGTAHELATPLSTIAIVARDVEKAFDEHPPEFPGAEDVIEDVHLIRSQLDRCRNIIDRMAGQAGQAIGETLSQITVTTLLEEILRELPDRNRVKCEMDDGIQKACLQVPLVGLSQALRGLFQNALDADSTGTIGVKIDQVEQQSRWIIRDQGIGMTEEVLQRLSEPFFTTKQPGKGMGLGVFLAKNVVERLDGSIQFASQSGKGTEVTFLLPLDNYDEPENDGG